MGSTIRISVKNLGPDFIKEMQEKYSDAELEITINRNPDFIPLTEEDFWGIIDLLDWEQSEDARIIEPAIQKLASLSIAHILQFQEIISHKLFLLDQKKYATQIGKSSFKPNSYFSVDTFLYARACVIANGKEAFVDVLGNPENMPKDITFEPVLYIAPKAYKRKTSEELVYVTQHNYETYSNKEGWEELA